MDETRLTAQLPNLEVEIVRREDPAANAEILTLNFRAVPSFEAFSRYLLGPTSEAPPLTAMHPFELWVDMWRRAWAPWLAAGESLRQIADDAAVDATHEPPSRQQKSTS
jgi:hypothetical protein